MSARTKDASAMAAKSPFDTDIVRDLAKLLTETDLSEIEVEKGDLRIYVARNLTQTVAMAAPAAMAATPVAVALAPVAAAPAPAVEHPGTVRSPMVGTAYRRPSPDAKPFVEVGSVVKAGDKVLLIEAMKTFNEIVAPRAGTIAQLMVDDAQPVEFGEALFVIE